MTIIVTLREPNPEWDGKNIKRIVNPIEFYISEFRFYALGRDNNDIKEIKSERIASILITF